MAGDPKNANHDPHAHRTLNVPDAPLDAANQSLADALRASFRVLKSIMVAVVVLFLFTGFTCVEEHQQAVVLRFGVLQDDQVRSPGLSWALPFPVDETLKVGVTAERLNFLELHTAREESKFGGLNPARDGALLTGDKGLAHVQWSVVYAVDDLPAFVRNVSDANDEKTRQMVEILLEHAAVRAAAQLTAREISQTRTDTLAREVKRLMNQELANLTTGLTVETVEIPAADVPLQTRDAFLNVTKAENEKKAKIQEARREANQLLVQTAGPAYKRLVGDITNEAYDLTRLLGQYDRAVAAGDGAAATPLRDAVGWLNLLDLALAEGDSVKAKGLRQEVERILEEEAAGRVGAELRSAYALYSEVVEGIRGDVEQFELLLEEYQQAPRLLIDRLWQETRQKILAQRGVDKWFLPAGRKEVRILLHPDPQARRQAEIHELRREAGLVTDDSAADFEVIVPGTID